MADAQAYVTGLLSDYGLGSLTDWLWSQIQSGATDDQIVQSLRQTPEYAARFPGLDQMRREGRAISENQWIAYESTARQLMRARGIPADYYSSPADLAKFIVNDVSVAELQQRIDQAASTIDNHFDLQAAQDVYGLNPGDLLGLFLDPTKAENRLMAQAKAIQSAGAAAQTGFGSLSQAQAEQAGGYGLSREQAVQGFGALTQEAELFKPLTQGETQIGTDTQIAAGLGGDAQAASQIQARARRRTAEFEQGGSYGLGRSGFSGVR